MMNLHIPQQKLPTQDAFVNNPKLFKQWLGALPYANMGELTRNVYTALREHNKQAMPDTDRFENLEMLREPLRSIFNNLKKYFTNRTLPLPEKSQIIVNLNQSILKEVAVAYKIIASNIANSESTQPDQKKIELAGISICRAIRYQSELMLRASEVYAQSPAGTWCDLHTMYHYAEQIGVNKERFDDSENTAEKSTIEDYYKQILLFSLARPIALRQRDTERMYHKLSEWSQLTRLDNTPDKNEIKRFFCVRIEEDRPPTYLKEQDCTGEYPVLTLDASALYESIQENINSAASESEFTFGEELSQETLQVLAHSWGIFSKRRFTRSSRIGQISASIGLGSITRALRNEEAIKKASDPLYDENLLTAREQLDASLTVSDTTPRNKDTDRTSNQSAAKESATTTAVTAGKNQSEFSSDDVDLHWEIVNVSAGGYCLRWNSDDTSKAQIGELIALREREPNGSYQWRVGAIRWMQYTREHGLEIGVQLLSPKVCTASIKRKNSSEKVSSNCLMLPGINPIKLAATILLPAHTFQVSDNLELTTLGHTMDIRLDKTKEKTGSFTQFLFFKTEVDIKPQQTENSPSIEDSDDFASIWSSL